MGLLECRHEQCLDVQGQQEARQHDRKFWLSQGVAVGVQLILLVKQAPPGPLHGREKPNVQRLELVGAVCWKAYKLYVMPATEPQHLIGEAWTEIVANHDLLSRQLLKVGQRNLLKPVCEQKLVAPARWGGMVHRSRGPANNPVVRDILCFVNHIWQQHFTGGRASKHDCYCLLAVVPHLFSIFLPTLDQCLSWSRIVL